MSLTVLFNQTGGAAPSTGTVRLPITWLTPQVSANQGNAYFTVAALTAWDAGHWELVNGASGNLYGIVHVPNNLGATPNAAIYLTLAANAVTGAVRLQVLEASVPAGSSLNPAALTAETLITTTVPGTARQRFDVRYPATGNLAVTPAANDVLIVRLFRDGGNAGDTLAAPVELYEATLQVDLA